MTRHFASQSCSALHVIGFLHRNVRTLSTAWSCCLFDFVILHRNSCHAIALPARTLHYNFHISHLPVSGFVSQSAQPQCKGPSQYEEPVRNQSQIITIECQILDDDDRRVAIFLLQASSHASLQVCCVVCSFYTLIIYSLSTPRYNENDIEPAMSSFACVNNNMDATYAAAIGSPGG